MPKPRPSKAELAAAYGKSVADVISPGLKVLFCGINPGLYTAAIGHHFGRPGNRFWPTLAAAGFTPRLFDPSEEAELLQYGFGITNIVNKATATAAELSHEELIAGGGELSRKVERFLPRFLAVLGVSAYRSAFEWPKAAIGLQAESLGHTRIWVLPNPSGLNAHYKLPDLADLFADLRRAAEV
jgi:TDG/mug DNA glycosylase family protein